MAKTKFQTIILKWCSMAPCQKKGLETDDLWSPVTLRLSHRPNLLPDWLWRNSLASSLFTLVWVLHPAFGSKFPKLTVMEKQTAEALAKKSFAFIKSAAKSGVAAITQSVSSVRKGYASKHEADVLSDLKSQGLHPAEHFHAGFSSLNILDSNNYSRFFSRSFNRFFTIQRLVIMSPFLKSV